MELDHRAFEIDLVDFKEMTFDVVNMANSQSITEAFPVFKKFPEFNQMTVGLSKSKVLKYICLMYDPKSPLRKKINDIRTRKFNALQYSGFKTNELGGYSEAILQMIQGMSPTINNMIFRFTQTVHSQDYQMLVGLEEGYQALFEVGLNDPKKVKEAEELSKLIDEYTQRVLNYDDSVILKQDYLDYILESRLNIKPEDIALTTMEGKDPIPKHINPYGLTSRKIKWIISTPEPQSSELSS